jgi:hypothetical protein
MDLFAIFSHFVSILALVSLAWVGIKINKIDKRLDKLEESHDFLKSTFVEIDDKLINFDIETHILEKMKDNESWKLNEMDEKEIADYMKTIINKHKDFANI